MDPLAPQFRIVLLTAALGAALILIAAVRLILSGKDRRQAEAVKRMADLRPAAERPATTSAVLNRTAMSRGAQAGVMARLATLLRQADVDLSATRFALVCGLAMVVVLLPAAVFLGPLPGLVAAVSLGAGVPYALVSARRTKRMSTFTAQLPDALDLMVRGLRVGHPLGATIANVAQAMPDPLGGEFRKMAEQIAYGDDLASAIRSLAERVDQEDMHYLAVSVSIQHSTGGNLAQMLSVLSRVIRDRIMMRRRVRAISSEGRISATLLSALPVVIYLATSITAPNYYGGVRNDPAFMPIACVIVALIVGNFLALRKLSSFRF